MKHLHYFLSSALVLFSLPSAAFGFRNADHDPKLSDDAASAPLYQTLPVIIQYKTDTTQQQAQGIDKDVTLATEDPAFAGAGSGSQSSPTRRVSQ